MFAPLPLIVLGLAAAWGLAPDELWDRVAGAMCGYLLLWAVAWVYRRLRGRDGLGLGDAKLLAAAGAWVGAGGLRRARRRRRHDAGGEAPRPTHRLAVRAVSRRRDLARLAVRSDRLLESQG